jgi:hypothetical protein
MNTENKITAAKTRQKLMQTVASSRSPLSMLNVYFLLYFIIFTLVDETIDSPLLSLSLCDFLPAPSKGA